MIGRVEITPGAMQFAVVPNGPRSCARYRDSGLSRPFMGIAALGGRCRASHRANGDDLLGALLLHDRDDGVSLIDSPEQIHLHDKL
jgi:hypothetical protein